MQSNKDEMKVGIDPWQIQKSGQRLEQLGFPICRHLENKLPELFFQVTMVPDLGICTFQNHIN